MSIVLDRIRRVWRDHVAGPTLRTYDVACEELGGAPWRALPDATDRWFIGNQTLTGRLPSLEKLPMLDTGALVLARGPSDTTKLVLLGGGALAVIALCLISLSGGASAHPMAAASAVTATAPMAAAAPSRVIAAEPIVISAAAPTRATAVAPTRATAAATTRATAAAAPRSRTISTPLASTRTSASVQSLFAAHAPARRHVVARHRRR